MKLKKRLLAMLLSLMMVASVAIQPISMVSATTGGETPIETDGTGGEAPPATMVITSASLSQGEELQVITQSSTTSVNLPKMNVTYDDSSVGTIDVTWTPDKAFDVNVAGTYTYTATVNTAIYSLAQGVTLPNFTVKVEALQEEQKTIKTITAVEVVNTQNFTAGSGEVLTLPQLNVTYDDNTTESIAVVWTADTVVFDVNAEGTYVYTASIDTNLYALAEGVTLPSFTAVVSGTQEPKPETKVEKVIKAIEPVEAKSFTVGDEVTALTFPQLTVTFEDDTQDSIDVTWTATEKEFVDTTAEGVFTYTATIGEGYKLLNDTVILPEFMVVVTAKTQEEPETRVLPDVTVLFDINGNYELDEDIGEVEIQVVENATIALSDLTGLAAGFEVATWKYYSYESGGSIKVEFSGQEGVTPTPVTSEMKDSDYHKVILTPYWTVWFDADEDNEYNAAVDLKIEVINTGSVHTTIRNRSPLDEMNPQASGWKICGTEDRFVFDDSLSRAIGESEFTKVTSNLKLCPVFEVPIIFSTSTDETSGVDFSKIIDAASVELGKSIGLEIITESELTIAQITDKDFLAENGYTNFEGWYTLPNGGGNKWVFGSGESATKTSETQLVELDSGDGGKTKVIVLYLKADKEFTMYTVNFYDSDYYTLITAVRVKEGETITSATEDINGNPLGDLVTGDRVFLEDHQDFRAWEAWSLNETQYIIWNFNENGTVVKDIFGEGRTTIDLFPNIYNKSEQEGDYYVFFDENDDGIVNGDDDIIWLNEGEVVEKSNESVPGNHDKWLDETGKEFILDNREVGVIGTKVDRNYIVHPQKEIVILLDDAINDSPEVLKRYYEEALNDSNVGALFGAVQDITSDMEGNTIDGTEISVLSREQIGIGLLNNGAGLNGFDPETQVLKGWYTAPNGGGTKFEFGANGTKLSNNNITFEATVEGVEVSYTEYVTVLYPHVVTIHTVGFDLDGDGNADTGEDTTVEDGKPIDKTQVPDTTTPPKYWVDEDGNEFEIGKTPVTEDEVLTPVYEVKFEDGKGNVDGANGKNPPKDVVSGTTLPTPQNPQTDGTLEFWYVDKNDNGVPDAGETVWNFNTDKVTENMTLTPHYKYNVSVNETYNTNNNGSGSYAPGTTVNINTGERPNYTFTGWTVTTPSGVTVTLNDASSMNTSFTMPNGSVTITANWVENTVPQTVRFTLTVVDGSGDGTYTQGTRVSVSHTDSATPEGQEFVGWDTNGDGVVDVAIEDFTYTMPGRNVVIRPVYQDLVDEFELTVNGGDGDGTYEEGEEVDITLGEVPEGEEFVGWDTDGDGDVDVTDEDFTFTMPDENTTITAVFEDVVDEFELTVNGGDGDGTYEEGEEVDITLGEVPEGQEFVGWDTDGDGVVDVTDEDFTFVMPDENTTITAIYEDIADDGTTGGTGDDTGGGTGGTITPPVDESEITKVTVGGNDLSEDDYYFDENGDLVISPDFIATLPDGRHVVRITTVDGENFEAVIIVEDGVPTSMSPFEPAYGWSLFDMIMTVVAVVIALIYLIVRPRKNDSEHYEAESEQKHKNRIITSIVLFVFALFSIILLIITQDFTQPMMIFDLWSIVFAIVALVQMVIIFFVRKKNDDEENSNQVMTF